MPESRTVKRPSCATLVITSARTWLIRSRSTLKLSGMTEIESQAASAATRKAKRTKGKASRSGAIPEALITMSSLSPFSLFSVESVAANKAIGATMASSVGSDRRLKKKKTRMLWPWPVIRSSSRSACVTQITAVSARQIARKAAQTVLKM
jgi:hypothetical protein